MTDLADLMGLRPRALSAVVVASALTFFSVSAGSASQVETQALPRLTTKVPRFVTRLCAPARARSPIPLVCPPLVPVTKYRRFPGVSGVLLGNSTPVKPPADAIYLAGFNAGDSGPEYWHWLAGIGTPEAIRYWVLSDARNEVRGKPKKVDVVRVQGRRVEIWRFPEHPAGGQLGGHVAAITRSGRYLAIASIHGYDAAELDARMAVALARKADTGR